MNKLQHEWDITAFLKELTDMGVESSIQVCMQDPSAICFEIHYRDWQPDHTRVRQLLAAYFGLSSMHLGSDDNE